MREIRSIPQLALVLLAGGALVALGGCSNAEASGGSAASPAAPPTTVPSPHTTNAAPAIVIDVRTPEEFATGHLEGARNIDVRSAQFDEQIRALDPTATYVVYCRSGNRSRAAIERMTELGVVRTTDGGSVTEAARITGLPVVS